MRVMLNRINFNNIKLFFKRNIIVISVCVFLILIAIALVPRAFGQPVKNVELVSDSLNFETEEPGAWKVNKSAKWIDKGVAEITFDVDTVMKNKNKYTDVLFVFDVSSSMSGDKLNKVKSDTLELVNTLLKNDKNRVGLISFDAGSSILLGLTSDKDKITDSINNLEVGNTTNYYQALVNVDKVLEGYVKEEDRACIVLFLTDGYPNVDTPNEVGQYGYLKKTYPFITINGIQYEMGDVVLEPIKNISDKQYLSNMSTLNNVLFDAAYVQEEYNEFIINDYIDTDYFSVKDSSDIKVSIGEAVLDGDSQVINWNLGSFKSGGKATMTIKAYLKEELIGKGGEYSTNSSEAISYKIGNTTDEVTSIKSPVLADTYKVKYDANVPDGCKISNVPEEKVYSVFDTVELSDKSLSCEGYQFKGWNITTKDVKRVNDDYFVMPEEDVEIKGMWGKVSIDKSMDGEVSTIQTVYKMMEEQAVPDDVKSEYVTSNTGIDFGSSVSSYRGHPTNGKGVYLRATTKLDNYPVLYYRGEVDNNNVKFGGFCWKIVRSTETGGIKLVYNGEPDVDGNCTNTKGEVTQIGTSRFNQNDSSPAGVGYMYGINYYEQNPSLPAWYSHIGKKMLRRYILLSENINSGTAYYYGNSAEWDSENKRYVLKNSDGSEVEVTEWGSETYASLKGKYTCLSTTITSCARVYYITNTTSDHIYYKTLINNQTLEDVNKAWNYGSKVIFENGVYIIKNPTEVQEVDWYAKYPKSGNYFCPDGGVSCSTINYLEGTMYDRMIYLDMIAGETYESLYQEALNKKWVYGNDVDWDGSKYILKDTYESSPINWTDDYKVIASKYHYSCFAEDDYCTEVGYIHGFHSDRPLYLKLRDGKKLEDAKNEMFANSNDSLVKQIIDTWYRDNMLEYTDKLEDTIWCNDRSIDRGPLKSKDEDCSITTGKNATNYTYFGSEGRNKKMYSPSLDCTNKRDRFTMNAEIGNGKLIYPVALLTADELTMAGHGYDGYSSSCYLNTEENTFTLSSGNFAPYEYDVSYTFSRANLFVLMYYGRQVMSENSSGIRPAISLAPGTIITGGDGTSTNPFTVLTD